MQLQAQLLIYWLIFRIPKLVATNTLRVRVEPNISIQDGHYFGPRKPWRIHKLSQYEKSRKTSGIGRHDLAPASKNKQRMAGLSLNVDWKDIYNKKEAAHANHDERFLNIAHKCVHGFQDKQYQKEFCFVIARHCDHQKYKKICIKLSGQRFPAERQRSNLLTVKIPECLYPCNWMMTTNGAVVRVCRFHKRTRQYCEDYDIHEITK